MSAKTHSHHTPRAPPCWNAIFTVPTTCARPAEPDQGFARRAGSADKVLAIALATLTYNKCFGGEEEHGHSLEDFK